MVIVLVVILLGLSYVLSKSSEVLVGGIKQLARGTKFEAYGLTTLIVALATSLPELFVSVSAALRGDPMVGLGVVMGSNIANVSLVLGGAALVSGVVIAKNQIYKREIVHAFLLGSMPMALLIDRTLSRWDGMILLLMYGFFVVTTMNKHKKQRLEKVSREYFGEVDLTHKILEKVGKKDVSYGTMKLAAGSALLIVSADVMVKVAEKVAVIIGAPVFLIALFMLAVGTSIPELTFELVTIKKREYMMALGNIIGSTVANSTLILGIVAMLAPLKLNGGAKPYFVSVIGFVVMYLMFWGFVWSKKRLERWEGAVLVAGYLLFVVGQLWGS